MKALVVYGSKRAGTEGLADMLGEALADHGLAVTVRAAAVASPDLESYDVILVGGALYAGRWHKDARRFLRRNVQVLRTKPVWLFSSGPLGDTASSAGELEPVRQVAGLMEYVGARGHVTFGGRLAPDAKGFPASAMAKTQAGDWRDPDQVRQWAKQIAVSLG